jgi:WD40 repeat protein
MKLWDSESGLEMMTLTAPTPLTAVAFSPDGHRLAASGKDGAVWLWEAAP